MIFQSFSLDDSVFLTGSPAPSALAASSPKEWQTFVRKYKAEMAAPDAARLLDLLAALSRQTDFSVGCYCADEARCHRSVLRELLADRGAEIV